MPGSNLISHIFTHLTLFSPSILAYINFTKRIVNISPQVTGMCTKFVSLRIKPPTVCLWGGRLNQTITCHLKGCCKCVWVLYQLSCQHCPFLSAIISISTKGYIQRRKLTTPVCLTDFKCACKKINGECSWNYIKELYVVTKDIVSTRFPRSFFRMHTEK